MWSILLSLHVLIGIFLIAFILVQQGKGASLGAAFGSGSSNTMFGSAGALPFLLKLTIVFAILFAVTSISLTRMVTSKRYELANPAHSVHTVQSPVPASARK